MRRLLALVAASVLLSGCASASPEATLQDRANATVEAANAGDADALRSAASLLLQEVNAQDARADLGASQAAALRTLINRILDKAALLEQSEEPSPAPAPVETTPEPEPSPTPTPSEPEPSEEPTPEPSPSQVVPSVVIGGNESPQPSPSQS